MLITKFQPSASNNKKGITFLKRRNLAPKDVPLSFGLFDLESFLLKTLLLRWKAELENVGGLENPDFCLFLGSERGY